MNSTFGAFLGARANGGQSEVDSPMVRPILPLKGGSLGAGTTVPLSDVPGGEKTPPVFFSFSWATAMAPGKNVRQAAIPNPRTTPRARYAATSSRFLMVQILLRCNDGLHIYS